MRSLQLFITGAVLVVLIAGLSWIALSDRSKRDAEMIARAPHVSDDGLTSAYAKNIRAAQKRFDGKIIVIRGVDGGEDEGLFGDGCIHMGDVLCDVGSRFEAAAVGKQVTVIGRCKGRDAYGEIYLSDARVLGQ